MNKLDIIFIIILSYTLIRGFIRGIVKEIIGIVGVIGSFLIAINFYTRLTDYITKIVSDPQVANIIAFASLFIGSILILYLLGAMIRELLKTLSLGWLDRLGGGVFGFVKGTLVCSLIILMLTLTLSPKNSLITTSRLSPYISMVTEKIIYIIPDDVKRKFMSKTEEMEKVWKGSVWYKLRHPELNK
ncbi:CvpA family protein [Desulfothermus okinawensis JCM 13304]